MYILYLLFFISLYAMEEKGANTPKHDLTTKVLVHNVYNAKSKVRLKDIVQLQGVRTNPLVGYGLVVGLNGTGDTSIGSPNTRESLVSMLERSGVNVRDFASKFSGKSVAAVMVTATLPSFARQGTTVDVTVSCLGDAKDIHGGTLIVTSLMGADAEVYAVAQGTVMTSAISAQGRATTITRGVPTSGKIPGGAIVEKEIGFELKDLPFHRLLLNNPDFTTAKRITEVINQHYPALAKALDPTTIELSFSKHSDILSLLTTIESFLVEPDQKAKIVIDQNEGVIVINDRVTISPSAVMHGSITVRVMELPQAVSQPMIVTPFVGIPSVASPPMIPSQINPLKTDAVSKGFIDRQNQDINVLQQQQSQQLLAFQAKQAQDLQDFNQYHPNPTPVQNSQFAKQQADDLAQFKLLQSNQMAQALAKHRQDLSQFQGQLQGQSSLQPTISPNAPSIPSPTILDRTKINIQEEKGRFAMVGGVNIEDVIHALNELGTNVKVISAILHNLKASGAIQAEIIVI